MGIYDYVHCEYPLPGLDDPTKIEFQTKSLDTFFDNYRITAEGKLEIEEYDVEDRSDPNAEGFARFIGCCARVPTGWKPVDFSGILNFYGDVYSGNLMLISFEGEGSVKMLDENGEPVPRPKTEWFEFDAEFKNGTLTNLSRVEEIRYE
jgi:hypothetical protein